MSKHKTITADQISAKLSQPGPALNTQPASRLPAPTTAQPMTLTLDQLRPYDRNPRTQGNPKHEEIRESIRAVGLKQKLTVTQRPGDDRYMISDGGNTRLAILKELYEETGDERLYHQDCHFIPWQGEINVLAGHLAENDNRGQLSWIERARGIYEAKRMIEEETGKNVSQRELTKRLRALGYTISHSHISRMLYTIEHFLPTLPLTLDSGMGRPQIEKLISYRQFCEECWNRCRAYWEAHADDLGQGETWASNVIDGDFAQAWHDEMAELDHDGQTEFRWSIVEDRLKGMLHDHLGLHFNPIDMSWKNWFTVRKVGQAASDEERTDIWTTVDAELERLRNPQERYLYPPKEEKHAPGTPPKLRELTPPDNTPGSETGISAGRADLTPPTPPSTDQEGGECAPIAGGTKASDEMQRMRAQLEELEQRNAELEAQSQQASVASSLSLGGEVSGGALAPDDDNQGSAPPARSPDEQETLIDDLTLSPHHESEGHRKLRHWQAQEHGEEAIDFEAAALKSVPLMAGGPVAPITDLWHVPAWRRNARDLRMQIGEVIQALAGWAEIEASGLSDVIRLNANEGLGFELAPLGDNPSRRAQLIWQLLAGLQGDIDPMLPADISLFGELVGSHGSDTEVRLPDGLFVRVFWLTRLIRVLRETADDVEGDPQ